jgi:hypothetical protein
MVERPPISRPAPWLFAATYALHLFDEGTLYGGLAHWATVHGFHFTIENWVFANAISIIVVVSAVHLVARDTWPSWVLVSISVHLTFHALAHAGASLWWSSISPGAITGLLVALPLAIWCLLWGWRALKTRTFVRAVLIGAATFQAPWDLLVRYLFGLRFWTA